MAGKDSPRTMRIPGRWIEVTVTVTRPVWFRVRGLCELIKTKDVTE
jgi:hypothetical protein